MTALIIGSYLLVGILLALQSDRDLELTDPFVRALNVVLHLTVWPLIYFAALVYRARKI